MLCCRMRNREQFWTYDGQAARPSPHPGPHGGFSSSWGADAEGAPRCWANRVRSQGPLPGRPQTSAWLWAWEKKKRLWWSHIQTIAGAKWEASGTPTFRGNGGLLRWHLIIFSHSRSSPGTRFLFLEEPLFADCEEGNTQELLLAATCFGKHWM